MLIRRYSATENSISLVTNDKMMQADLSGMDEKKQNDTIKHFLREKKNEKE